MKRLPLFTPISLTNNFFHCCIPFLWVFLLRSAIEVIITSTVLNIFTPTIQQKYLQLFLYGSDELVNSTYFFIFWFKVKRSSCFVQSFSAVFRLLKIYRFLERETNERTSKFCDNICDFKWAWLKCSSHLLSCTVKNFSCAINLFLRNSSHKIFINSTI